MPVGGLEKISSERQREEEGRKNVGEAMGFEAETEETRGAGRPAASDGQLTYESARNFSREDE